MENWYTEYAHGRVLGRHSMESEEKRRGEYTPKVSVIIPIFNVEKYIKACLDSVSNQTLKEIEIICVNDGTPDHSMEIVYEKALRDKRIRIVERENKGLSAARNTGLKQATGEYVIFLDSDDTLKEKTLEILYRSMSEKRLQQIFFEADVLYDTLKVKRDNYIKYHKYYHRKGTYPQVETGTEILKKLLENKEYRMSVCLQMFQKQFLVENGLFFLEGILHEDNLFTPQVMLKADRVMVIRDCFYIRRLRSDSIMLTGESRKSSWGYFGCYQKLQELLKEYPPTSIEAKCLKSIVEQTLLQAVVSVRNCNKDTVLEALKKEHAGEEVAAYEKEVWNSTTMKKQQKIWMKIKYKLIDLIR